MNREDFEACIPRNSPKVEFPHRWKNESRRQRARLDFNPIRTKAIIQRGITNHPRCLPAAGYSASRSVWNEQIILYSTTYFPLTEQYWYCSNSYSSVFSADSVVRFPLPMRKSCSCKQTLANTLITSIFRIIFLEIKY